jgi:putative flippase GtrA
MSVQKSRVFALIGIIIGIIVTSIASDELTLIQAQTQAQKDLARFYIGNVAVVSSLAVLVISLGITQKRSVWIDFVRAMAATVTVINVIFLSIIPQILIWMKS